MKKTIAGTISMGAIGGIFLMIFGIMEGYEWINDIAVIAAALLSYYYLWQKDRKIAIMFIISLGLLSWLLEYVGISTCFPYGCFTYGSMTGKLRGIVPWGVFFAWAPLVLGSYVLARFLTTKPTIFLPVALIILVLTDFVLDPGAVHSGMRSYGAGGWYYGVPWSNFGGRLLSGTIGLGITHRLCSTLESELLRDSSLTLTRFFMLSFWMSYARATLMIIPGIIGVGLLVIGLGLIRKPLLYPKK